MSIIFILDFVLSITSISAFVVLFVRLSPLHNQFAKLLQYADLIIGIIFIVDVLIRAGTSDKSKEYVKKYWYEIFVLFYILSYHFDRYGIVLLTTAPIVIVRLLIIIYMGTTRGIIAHHFFSNAYAQPARLMFATFLTTIITGTLLLMTPSAASHGHITSFVDALFTATSATCVTGLSVQDITIHFSKFGQIVIVTLIQIGGLGFMTFSAFLILVARKNMHMQHRIVLSGMLSQDSLSDATRIIRAMIIITFGIEFCGTIILSYFWKDRFPTYGETLYHSAFHSISAFCNAGFSTLNNNLMNFKSDIATNIIICLLIICGGLGFPVIVDLLENFRNKIFKKPQSLIHLRVQTKMVLLMTCILIVCGAGLIFLFQASSDSNVGSRDLKSSILVSIFQSVSARTAGFNTCDIARLSEGSLLTLMVLMFIGASPISTAGGIKTTTFAVLWAVARSGLLQRDQVEIFKRTIPHETIYKAITLLFFYGSIIIFFILVLLYLEYPKQGLMPLMFESISAIGTVGLSMNLTPLLCDASKVAVTLLMFIGRLGPLTVAYVFLLERKRKSYMYAEERIIIG